MGCLSTKPSAATSRNGSAFSIPYSSSHASKRGLSKDEIQMRIVAPKSCQTFIHSGIAIKYAWVSQRGYYPDSLDKDNQDSCSAAPCIFPKDGILPEIALFGVYDGHGPQGHLCSRFVSTQVSHFF